MTVATARATLADLAATEGKAELVGGKLVHLMATGFWPNIIAGRIFFRLTEYALATGVGQAFTDNMGFAVPELVSSGRESFSPDAAYYTGPRPARRMRFVAGPPDFAVEVRSEDGYGRAAEAEAAAKRADYFEAGTRVVWDVDPEAGVVHKYRAGEPTPTVFAAGQDADAEPAAPGWRLAIDWLMTDDDG